MAEEVKKEVGDITILVNNAGIAYVRKFENHSIDQIKDVFDVNIMAHYWVRIYVWWMERDKEKEREKKRE